jgi:hypothetical protein
MGGRADELNPTHLFVAHPVGALWTIKRTGARATRVRRALSRRTLTWSCG